MKAQGKTEHGILVVWEEHEPRSRGRKKLGVYQELCGHQSGLAGWEAKESVFYPGSSGHSRKVTEPGNGSMTKCWLRKKNP